MKIIETPISGCYEIRTIVRKDIRGRLVKTFHKKTFLEMGLHIDFPEQYYSVSKKKVLRGLHFQIPSKQHIKLVTCLEGVIQDVIVDLRVGSPTYGEHFSILLNSELANMLYIPAGCAHGFLTISEKSIFLNRTSTMYSEAHDYGIHWNSCGIHWAGDNPILSEKDNLLPPLESFNSPFKFYKYDTCR
jgi:dTDP-4-dehydrorhamnose 3,5-epimerase